MVIVLVGCFFLTASWFENMTGPWNRTHGFWGLCVFSWRL